MTTINIDDVQCDLSNKISEKQEPNNNVIAHQPSSSHVQIDTQTLSNPYVHQTLSSSISQNNDILPVGIIHNSTNGQYPYSGNIHEIPEFTKWSVFNLIFCCIFIGAFALNMSCTTKRRKRHGDFLGAHNASKLAVLLNMVATLSGILIIILATLRFTGHIIV